MARYSFSVTRTSVPNGTGPTLERSQPTTDYSEYEFLKIEVVERVATDTINRPSCRNAVNAALHHEFEQVWLDLAEDRDVNAILLTGAGDTFSVGGDISSDKPTKSKGRGGRRIVMAHGPRVIENLLDVEQPIVATINGDALGFAANVALHCDVTVASETARSGGLLPR